MREIEKLDDSLSFEAVVVLLLGGDSSVKLINDMFDLSLLEGSAEPIVEADKACCGLCLSIDLDEAVVVEEAHDFTVAFTFEATVLLKLLDFVDTRDCKPVVVDDLSNPSGHALYTLAFGPVGDEVGQAVVNAAITDELCIAACSFVVGAGDARNACMIVDSVVDADVVQVSESFVEDASDVALRILEEADGLLVELEHVADFRVVGNRALEDEEEVNATTGVDDKSGLREHTVLDESVDALQRLLHKDTLLFGPGIMAIDIEEERIELARAASLAATALEAVVRHEARRVVDRERGEDLVCTYRHLTPATVNDPGNGIEAVAVVTQDSAAKRLLLLFV